MLKELENLFSRMEHIVGLRSKLLEVRPEADSSRADLLRRKLAEQLCLRELQVRRLLSSMGLEGASLQALQNHLSGPQLERFRSISRHDRKLSRRLRTASGRLVAMRAERRRELRLLLASA